MGLTWAHNPLKWSKAVIEDEQLMLKRPRRTWVRSNFSFWRVQKEALSLSLTRLCIKVTRFVADSVCLWVASFMRLEKRFSLRVWPTPDCFVGGLPPESEKKSSARESVHVHKRKNKSKTWLDPGPDCKSTCDCTCQNLQSGKLLSFWIIEINI